MILSFLFLLLLLSPLSLSPRPIYADDFNIMGDSRYSRLRHTTTLGTAFLPPSTAHPSSFLYDEDLLSGTPTYNIVDSVNVHNLTNINGWQRIPDIFTNVSGPPGTMIDILYHYINEAGHPFSVSKVFVPFSQSDPDLGNWLDVVKTDTGLPEERSISVFFDLRWVRKNALLKEYTGPGELEDMQEGFLLLDTLEIVNPIKILDVQVEDFESGNGVRISVEIENITEEELFDISFEHLDNYFEFTMQPYEVVSMEYEIENLPQEVNSNLGYFKIHNPNTNTQCAIYGNRQYLWFSGEGVTVNAFREDGGWVNGGIVQPEGNTYCISRIPYTMTSELLEYEIISFSDNIEVEEVENVVSEVEVLGVEDKQDVGSLEYEELGGENFVLPNAGVVRW